MSRWDMEYPNPPGTTDAGVPLTFFDYVLHRVPFADRTDPKVPNAGERFIAQHAEYMEEWFDIKYFRWRDDSRRIEFDRLCQTFSLDELCKMWWADVVMSKTSERFECDPRFQLLKKIRNSMWHYGWADDYNLFVRYVESIRRFDFGLPGFEVRLNHTTGCNEMGWGQYGRKKERYVYLDGVFGYSVLYKGEHVLTIGFSVADCGVLITQVQLRNKKGNRWLYKLPTSYLEHVIERMRLAFSESEIYLVDGPSMAGHIRKQYKNVPDGNKPQESTLKRIALFYSQELTGYQRDEVYSRMERRFHCIRPRLAIRRAG